MPAAAPLAAMDSMLVNALEGKRPSTRLSYESALARCLAITDAPSLKAMLMGRSKSYNKLAAVYTNVQTLKTRLAIISSIAAANPVLLPDGCARFWKECMVSAVKTAGELAGGAANVNKSSSTWIEYASIKLKLADLIACGHSNKRASLDIVIMAMYAYLPPKRADLGRVRIVAQQEDIDASENAVIIPETGEASLVLNVYKTSKTRGQFVETLPQELTHAMHSSLEAHPRTYLIDGRVNKPLSENRYSARVMEAMDRVMGAALSVKDLRCMYVAQHLQESTYTERAAMARSMMMSVPAAQTACPKRH